MAGAVVSKVKGVIGSAKDKAKSLLGINSPSKVFAEYGRNTIQGFINGLDRDQNKLKRGMDRVMGTVAGYNVNAPELAGIANSGAARDLNQLLGAQVDGSLSTEGPVVKQFNYYAAEGSSLGSEEDLFAAAERGRMVGW